MSRASRYAFTVHFMSFTINTYAAISSSKLCFFDFLLGGVVCGLDSVALLLCRLFACSLFFISSSFFFLLFSSSSFRFFSSSCFLFSSSFFFRSPFLYFNQERILSWYNTLRYLIRGVANGKCETLRDGETSVFLCEPETF